MSKFYPKAIFLFLLIYTLQLAVSQKQVLYIIPYRDNKLDAVSQAKTVNAGIDLRNFIFANTHDSSVLKWEVKYGQLDYDHGPEQLPPFTIAMVNPLVYANFVYGNKAAITPILMTTKWNNVLPYYQSMFITAKNSGITDIYSDKIKTIYLVHGNSASGFLIPVYQLYYDSLIKRPDTHALGKRYHFEFCGSHEKVIEKVLADPNSIGATCYTRNDESLVTLQRFGCIPEDPIIITADLLPYKELIIAWFKLKMQKSPRFFENDMGRLQITGITDYTTEHENSFRHLYNLKLDMYKCLKECPETAAEMWEQKWHRLATVGICVLMVASILSMFVFAYKASNNPAKMEKFSSYSMFSCTVFVGLVIELIRLQLEGHHKMRPETAFVVAAIVSLVLEINKHRFIKLLSFCLQKIHPVVKGISDGIAKISNKNSNMW